MNPVLKTISLVSLALIWAFTQPAAASGTPAKPIVYIVHGYRATPADHWFPWLQAQLVERGIETRVLALPDSSQPSAQAWADYLDRAVDRHDRATYFVAHSLGCIALLKHLQRQPSDIQLGGMVLVSGFSAKLPALPQLDAFVGGPVTFNGVRQSVAERYVIAARDDQIVPYPLSVELARQLDAPLLSVDHGGHFLGSDGFTRMPQVLTLLWGMIR